MKVNSINKISAIQFENEPYIVKTDIDQLLLIQRPQYPDERGSFQEQFRVSHIVDFIKRPTRVAQSQLSYSNPNVLRGIHAEPWDKFITPLEGQLINIIVDMRPSSKTFGNWMGFEFDQSLPSSLRTTLFVPKGCGNAMLALKNTTNIKENYVLYQYSSSDLYTMTNKGLGIVWNDPDLKIPWPVKNPTMTDKDKNLPRMESIPTKLLENLVACDNL